MIFFSINKPLLHSYNFGTFATFQEGLSTVEYTGITLDYSLEFLYTKRYIHKDGALINIKLQNRIL